MRFYKIFFYNDFKVYYRINKSLANTSLFKLKHTLTKSNNFIIIGLRNPIKKKFILFFEIMKFFYSDENIQGFYNKYTVQN